MMPAEVTPSSSITGGFGEIMAGAHHTCARQPSASRLWCWGANGGVLGHEEPYSAHCANPEPLIVDTFPEGAVVHSAAAGNWHMIAIVEDDGVQNQIFTWGDESNSRLGFVPDGEGNRTPEYLMRGVAAAGGLRHTCVIGEDTSLWCFGTNAAGEVGVSSDALSIAPPVQLRDEGWETLGLGRSARRRALLLGQPRRLPTRHRRALQRRRPARHPRRSHPRVPSVSA
jgi:alpha-tubulin suppressor-like RCC1 family protein